MATKKELVESGLEKIVRKMLKEESDYAAMANRVPWIGKTVIVNSGRFENEEGVVIGTGEKLRINAYLVKFSDGTKAFIMPTDLKVKGQ